MPDRVVTVGLLLGATLVLVAGASLLLRQTPRYRAVAGAIALLAFNFGMITSAFGLVPQVAPVLGLDLQFNWQGKIFALASTLTLVCLIPGLSRRDVGLVWAQKPGSLRPAVFFAAMICVSVWLSRFGVDRVVHAPGLEAILFQATLPGLDEEILYRGALLVLLCRAWGRRDALSTRWTGGFITSAAFGLAHGLSYADGAVSLQPAPVLMTGVLGLTFFWLKERTGSLIMPIVTHNAINIGFQFL